MTDQPQAQAEADSTPSAAHILAPDLEVIEDVIDGLPIEVARLAPAAAPVDLVGLDSDIASLVVARVGGPLHSVGSTAPGIVTFTLLLGPGEGSWNGHPLDPTALWIYAPGTEHDGVGRVPPTWAALSLDETWVASRTGGDARAPGGASSGLSVVRNDAVIGLRETVAGIESMLREHPSSLRLTLAAAGLEEAVGEVLASDFQVDGLPKSASARVVADCIALSRDLGPRPSLPELAAALGVSERWIRAAFRKEFGVAPAAYFRYRALNGAHRELLARAPAETNVTETAMRWGFWHLGRFSGTYRWMFGEMPSETLRRSTTDARLPIPDSPLGVAAGS